MTRNETFYDAWISKDLIVKNEEERKSHVSSGKLSASSLGSPLQWQVLKYIGIEQQEFDAYTLRKFLRGKTIEDWFIQSIPNVVETQKEVYYRDVIGFVDAMVDTKDCDFPLGIIPCEIKSVTNMKYKHLEKQNAADRPHRLQAGLYALATGSEHFAVNYIASDDLRVLTFVFDTKDIKDEIDDIITRFENQVAKKTVPLFEPEEKWQSNALYQNYPAFADIETEIPFTNLLK